jgi:ceramide glucosyltransferase
VGPVGLGQVLGGIFGALPESWLQLIDFATRGLLRLMDLLAFLSYVAAAWWLIGALALVLSALGALLQPWVQARRATNREAPPISAILPMKLVNPGFEIAQASIFTQAYPNYEVLFSAAEAKSAAIDIVGALRRAHLDVACRLVQSHVDFAVSPKLNTLATAFSVAQHDLVVTKDSNIVFAPGMFEALMQNLTPDVGLVCCVPVAENAEGLAGHIEAFLINGHARLLLTASVLGLGFGVGKVMAFRQSDLARAGGVEAVAYTIAEDTAISEGLAAIGLKTVFAHRTVSQEIGRRSIREIFDRQLRWGVIRRTHEPVAFGLEPLSCALPTALAGALAAPLVGVAPALVFAATLSAWFCVEIGVARVKGWEISAFAPAAFLGREILALAAWLRAWTTDRVVWANGRFDVFDGAATQKPRASFAIASETSGPKNR